MSKFSVFKDKEVLITGHTGFKGSWLTSWLLELGAKVIGLSADVPSSPSHFDAIDLLSKITHIWGDIRDFSTCSAVIKQHQPDFFFHLAAQPLVRKSYLEPHETFATNTGGTSNILEALVLVIINV